MSVREGEKSSRAAKIIEAKIKCYKSFVVKYTAFIQPILRTKSTI